VNRLALINCYMGKFPHYFQLFLDSAARNPEVDFYIFNDSFAEIKTPSNVKIIYLSLSEFNQLASTKLSLLINIPHDFGYKMNDLKPAYGVIFEDYIKDYEFWGYCDIDIIWGKITDFLTEDVLANYDVFTAEETHNAGHFTVFRNSGVTVDLFRQTDDYKTIFTDPYKAYWYDESCQRFGKYYPIQELIDSSQTVSTYDIIRDLEGKQQLKLFIKYLVREYPDPFQYVYRNGGFQDSSTFVEISETDHKVFKVLETQDPFMYFHLYHVKDDWRFYISQFDSLPSEFTITEEGMIPALPSNSLAVRKWKVQKTVSVITHLLSELNDIGVGFFLKESILKLYRRITKGESLRLKEIMRTGSHYPL
jgi:hypothetical protein